MWVLPGAAVVLAVFVAPVSAQVRAAQIICPLGASQAALPCCGPPLAQPNPTAPTTIPCCATLQPIACPATVTIGSTPDPSTAGGKVAISGRSSSGAAGTSVLLWQKVAGATAFKQVARTAIGAAGQYRLVRPAVETNRQWYVTVGAERSVTIEQRVRALVTLTRSLTVHVSPNHVGARVLIEKRTNRGWKVIARLRLGRSSSSNGPARAALGSQTIAVRAVFPGDARNLTSASPVLMIRP
jgi:hypothetical protein